MQGVHQSSILELESKVGAWEPLGALVKVMEPDKGAIKVLAMEVQISRMAYLLDTLEVVIQEMEALAQVRAVMDLETEDPMDMEVQGMVEAEAMAVMEVTEAMETRMAQDQIMADLVTRRDLVMEAIEVLEDVEEQEAPPLIHQAVMEAKEALEDGRMQTHSSVAIPGTISLHIIMKNMDLFIVMIMLAGHWKKCRQGIQNGSQSYNKLW